MNKTFVLACLLLVACEEKKETKPKTLQAEPTAAAPAPAAAAPAAAAPAAPAAGPEAEAREVFNTRCATCHGTAGKGDGLASAALNPKPRDMTDPAWQKSVTDDHLKKVIVEGGAAVGKSALMAANPDLKDKPAVVEALVKIVRGYGSK
jgi:mono/diheme cytochrome c family protein